MSSTNVHSSEYKHLCGGQVIPKEDRTIEMPPQTADRGPSKLEVLEGPNAVLTALDNIVVRDDNKEVVARGTESGQLLSGDKKALQEAVKGKNNGSKDMGRE